jgi:uncharacterized protein (DUF486 family)
MITALLLFISNIFMTLAWYGHLKFKDKPLWLVIVASWALAFFEYLFQVPANRIGSTNYTLVQLKVMQECITIFVFTIIVWLVFRQMPRWNNIVSFLLIVLRQFISPSILKSEGCRRPRVIAVTSRLIGGRECCSPRLYL